MTLGEYIAYGACQLKTAFLTRSLIKPAKSILLCLLVLGLSACTVVKIADIAASTTIGTMKTAVKVVAIAVPDGDEED